MLSTISIPRPLRSFATHDSKALFPSPIILPRRSFSTVLSAHVSESPTVRNDDNNQTHSSRETSSRYPSSSSKYMASYPRTNRISHRSICRTQVSPPRLQLNSLWPDDRYPVKSSRRFSKSIKRLYRVGGSLRILTIFQKYSYMYIGMRYDPFHGL